jgi:hypothetical protein
MGGGEKGRTLCLFGNRCPINKQYKSAKQLDSVAFRCCAFCRTFQCQFQNPVIPPE